MSFFSYDDNGNEVSVQPLMRVNLKSVSNPLPSSKIVYALKNNIKYVHMFSFTISSTTNTSVDDYIDTLPSVNLDVYESIDALNNATSIFLKKEFLYDKSKELANIDPLPTTEAPTTTTSTTENVITSTTEIASTTTLPEESTTIGPTTEQPITSEPP